MKINPITNPNILRAYQAVKPVQESTKVTPGRDVVTFSDEALSFSKALAEARDAIEIRTPEEKAHFDDISNAIAQGQYRVDSDKIADKILESVLNRK